MLQAMSPVALSLFALRPADCIEQTLQSDTDLRALMTANQSYAGIPGLPITTCGGYWTKRRETIVRLESMARSFISTGKPIR